MERASASSSSAVMVWPLELVIHNTVRRGGEGGRGHERRFPPMDYLAAIRRDAAAAFELCAREPGRAIPSCPEWSAADLQQHLVDTFRGEVPGYGDDALPPLEAIERAISLLQQNSLSGRDVAHECAVHRWDASEAFGVAYAIEPELACDGVDEFFDAAWPMWLDYFKRPAGNGETLRLRRTDGPKCWLITLDKLPVVTYEDGEVVDVEVRGSASDLVLWLWGRMDPPEVHGDVSVLERMCNPSGRFLSPGF